MLEAFYPNDVKALDELGVKRHEFETWFVALNAENAKRGFPYGEGCLASTTGIECWVSFFDDGYDPTEAIDEDLSNG